MTRGFPFRTIDVLLAGVCVIGLAGVRPILDRVHDARDRRATLEDVAAQPPPTIAPLLPPALISQAESMEKAQAQLTEILRQTAVREGLLIEDVRGSQPPADRVVSVEVALSGDTAHILRFAEAIENRTPLIRFYAWRLINPAHGGSAKLSATAASLWAPKP